MTTPLCERKAIYYNRANRSFGALENVKITYQRRILLEQRKSVGQQDIQLIKDALHNIGLIEEKQKEVSYKVGV